MSIPETIRFDKNGEPEAGWRGRELIKRLFLTFVILLTAALSLGVGFLIGSREGQGSKGVSIEFDPSLSAPPISPVASASAPHAGSVVASKGGSKYHYPSCPGAKQIKEENKLTFPSAAVAEAAGYVLAANCTPK